MARPEKGKAEESKNLNARIPKELAKRLKIFCVQNEMTIQDFIVKAIQEKLEK